MKMLDSMHGKTAWSGGGKEAGRLLYDTLVGRPGHPKGLLNGFFTYRGIDLARLFEGTWITLIWPEWFTELAAIDYLACSDGDEIVSLEPSSPVRQAALQCVKARHPEIRVRSSKSRLPQIGGTDSFFSMAYRFLRVGRCIIRACGSRRIAPKRKTQGGIAFFPWSCQNT